MMTDQKKQKGISGNFWCGYKEKRQRYYQNETMDTRSDPVMKNRFVFTNPKLNRI